MKINLTNNKHSQGEIVCNGHHLGYWMFNEGIYVASFLASYWICEQPCLFAIGLTMEELRWKIEQAVNS